MSSDSAIGAYWSFFESFNSREAEAFSAALNYPHVRVSPRRAPNIVPTPEQHAAAMSWQPVLAMGWHHTNGHEPQVVHDTDDCAHIVGGWTRVDADDRPVLVNRVSYIVTRTAAGWGIQCRFGTDAGSAEDGGESDVHHAAGVAVVEDYVDAFSDRDWAQCVQFMHVPHFKIDVGMVREWSSGDALERALEEGPWHFVTETSARAVQGGENSVTVALDGLLDGGDRSVKALFFVVRQDGRWGIQARSIIIL